MPQVESLAVEDGPDQGPCGMWIEDLLAPEGELWVATELGVSRPASSGSGRRHFVPDGDAPGGLREAGNTARAMLRKLLQERRPQLAAKLRWSASR
jgi:hypothetical protein